MIERHTRSSVTVTQVRERLSLSVKSVKSVGVDQKPFLYLLSVKIVDGAK